MLPLNPRNILKTAPMFNVVEDQSASYVPNQSSCRNEPTLTCHIAMWVEVWCTNKCIRLALHHRYIGLHCNAVDSIAS
jgi:hypothetical protein